MQKVKMVDYAHTDLRSFKNTLLRDQAKLDEDDKGVQAPVASKAARAPKYAKKHRFDTITAVDFGSFKAAGQLAVVVCAVSALCAAGRLCGLV